MPQSKRRYLASVSSWAPQRTAPPPPQKPKPQRGYAGIPGMTAPNFPSNPAAKQSPTGQGGAVTPGGHAFRLNHSKKKGGFVWDEASSLWYALPL